VSDWIVRTLRLALSRRELINILKEFVILEFPIDIFVFQKDENTIINDIVCLILFKKNTR